MSYKAILSALLLAVTSGCVMSSHGHGPRWVGQTAEALISSEGAPDQQMTTPLGAGIYVYRRRSIDGTNVLCTDEYYVQKDQIVGFKEHGMAVNCGGSAGASLN